MIGRVVRAIHAVSTAAGWLARWFIVPMTIAVTWEVIARYAFNARTKWSYDVGYMLYGAQFMLAAAYTLRQGGHIRTDLVAVNFQTTFLSRRWRPRRTISRRWRRSGRSPTSTGAWRSSWCCSSSGFCW